MSSVRKKDQHPHKLTILDLALDVYDHTTNVIKNEKIFDPKFKSLIDKMDLEASLIYHYCRSANEDYDNRVPEEALVRLELQEQAIQNCMWLKTDIKLSQRKFHLRARKVCYWTELVNTALKAIKAWHISEERNYKEQNKNGL